MDQSLSEGFDFLVYSNLKNLCITSKFSPILTTYVFTEFTGLDILSACWRTDFQNLASKMF